METITIDPLIVTLIVGTIIPILTGIVTKLNSSTGVKAIVAVVLSTITGVVAQLVVDNPDNSFEWKPALVLVVATFLTNLAAYLGLWKPIGSTDQVPLQNLTAPYGIG